MSKQRGVARERELANLFDEHGFAAIRAPGSGGGTKRALPDLLVGNGKRHFAIECKYRTGDSIYIDGVELEALLYFSQVFGARPRVAVRFAYQDWRFYHPGELYRTEGGNYRAKREAEVPWTSFTSLVG